MIILRKDQLNVVPVDHELMTRPPKEYDFENELASAKAVSNVLFAKMEELGAIGLSANQVGVDLRVFVMGKDAHKIAVFNPEILEIYDDKISLQEGCVSYPGIFLNITRPQSVRVKYTNQEGLVLDTIFTGITARIFLHEYDHMQGRDFTHGVSKMKLGMALKKYNNKRKKIIQKYAHQTMINALKEGNENGNSKSK